ncbi:MAG: hypothetical protein ACPGU7_12960 [Gammaproteobacteria bacterium]
MHLVPLLNTRASLPLLLGSALAVAPLSVTAQDAPVSGAIQEVLDNAAYTLRVGSEIFPSSPGSASAYDDSVHLLTVLSMKSSLALGETSSLEFTARAGWSSQGREYDDILRMPGSDHDEAQYLDFDRLNITHYGDAATVMVGKEIIETGVSEMNSANDRFGLANGKRPQAPMRYGVWHASMEYYVEDDTITGKIMPFHERSLSPSPRSRWAGASGDSDFTNVTLPLGTLGGAGTTIEDEYYNEGDVEDWGYFLKYAGTREGYDFFVLGHHGPSIYPTLVQQDPTLPVYKKVDPLAWSFGGGVSMVTGAWKLYGEGIAQITDNDADEDFLRYTLGASYRETEWANSVGWQEFKPIVEFYGDETLDEVGDTTVVASSESARPFHNAIGLRLEMTHDDMWSFAPAFNLNFEEGDWVAGIGAQYRPNDNLTFRAAVSVFDGDDETYYGRWRRNDNLHIGAEYKF